MKCPKDKKVYDKDCYHCFHLEKCMDDSEKCNQELKEFTEIMSTIPENPKLKEALSKQRSAIWEEALRRAKGDKKKAFFIMDEVEEDYCKGVKL